MMTFALGRPLIFLCFLPLLLAPCHARDCKTETASALLQAAVGSGHGCSEKAEVKVCAPAGKTVKTWSVRDVSATPNIDYDKEVKNLGGGCVQVSVTVRARSVIGPSFLEYCPQGSYEGRVELIHCR